MHKIIQLKERLACWVRRPKVKVLIVYIGIFLVLILWAGMIWRFIFCWPQMKAKHEPNGVSESTTYEESALVTYNYYLDYSPSMEGFISLAEGNMSKLARVIREINSGRTEDAFYRCGSNINDCPADIFYRYMSDSGQIAADYNNVKESGNIYREISGIDLSKLFSDNKFSHDSSRLNVIITDLNFYDNRLESSVHDEKMDVFTRKLASAARNANISIYQIMDDYKGIGVDDVDLRSEYIETINNCSFFLIIFSENDRAFDEYIRSLELRFGKEGINEYNKVEYKNNPLKDKHFLIVDDSVLYGEAVSKINFNFNNDLIKERKEYEIGLCMTEGNYTSAFFQGSVAALNVEGLYGENGEGENNSRIDVKVKTFFPNGIKGLQEYTDGESVRSTSAGLTWNQDKKKLYLSVGIECGVPSSIPEDYWWKKEYFVAELKFFMEKPEYSVPDWVIELDTEGKNLDIEKKRKITELIKGIKEEKEICFAEYATEYEKYMGTLCFYISY